MKTLRITILAFITTLSAVYAVDPSSVNGVVTITVDRSTPQWKVTIHNQSKEILTYEMMGVLPRGLGVEHWSEGKGVLLHAGDLAKWADVDGFPADIRELKAGAKMSFDLNPGYLSATDQKVLKAWKREQEAGHYTCRVVFGRYASRKFETAPPVEK